MLEFDDAASLRALAILGDEARLSASKLENEGLYVEELKELLGTPEERREKGHAEKVLELLESQRERWLPILTDVRNTLNRHRLELFNDLVHLRNLLFAANVATGVVRLHRARPRRGVPGRTKRDGRGDGLLSGRFGGRALQRGLHALATGPAACPDPDIGLEFVRLLTIPQLSGIAGVLGVVITRLGGTATASGTPALAEVFSLADYPFGIVVAAVFGLTPGLLLARLREQTDEYKEELTRTGTGGEKQAQS